MADLPEHAQKTIADLEEKIAELERQANSSRAFVNELCALYGAEPRYDRVSFADAPRRSVGAVLRPDEFFGKPFSTCVREILVSRRTNNLGPAEPREIFDTLKRGGFDFDQKDDEVAFRAMQISIGKNSATFVKLPSGQIGLEEWYDRPRRSKSTTTRVASISTSGLAGEWPQPAAAPAASDLGQTGGTDAHTEEPS